jgi:23S rRNA (cytosine1962-C5)-methyltransferase
MPASPSERPTVQFLPGHDRRLGGGHPWAYANELRIDAGARRLPPGGLIRLTDAAGRPLGTAMFNVHSLIAARLLSDDPDAVVDRRFPPAVSARRWRCASG